LALHAVRIQFPHPITGRPIDTGAPLPADLREFLDTLSPA
jgi:hypothetical protein